MTHEEYQAELLDTYLDALQHNRDAMIPDGLDPDMADFARMFVIDDASKAQLRVWQQIQSVTENMPFNTDNRHYQEMDTHMKKLYEKNKRSGKRSGWIPMAAVAILTVIIGIGLAFTFLRDDTPQQSAVIEEQFRLTATELVANATQTVSALQATPTQHPTVTPPSTATMTATPTIIASATWTATPITRATQDVTLLCDFERDLILRINQNQLGVEDELIVSGLARTPGTSHLFIEIFGGVLTDDAYVLLVEMDNPRSTEIELARIDGSAYEPGSYLLQLRLSDSSGETLSSCALPVIFTGN